MRGKHVMLGFIIYGLGVTFNGIFFMIIKDWRIVLFLYLFIPFVFMMCGLLFLDGWMDSIVNYSPEESLMTFQRIALLNDKFDHGLTL
jgi:ABC-type Na+ efflux pump permease subunit